MCEHHTGGVRWAKGTAHAPRSHPRGARLMPATPSRVVIADLRCATSTSIGDNRTLATVPQRGNRAPGVFPRTRPRRPRRGQSRRPRRTRRRRLRRGGVEAGAAGFAPPRRTTLARSRPCGHHGQARRAAGPRAAGAPTSGTIGGGVRGPWGEWSGDHRGRKRGASWRQDLPGRRAQSPLAPVGQPWPPSPPWASRASPASRAPRPPRPPRPPRASRASRPPRASRPFPGG